MNKYLAAVLFFISVSATASFAQQQFGGIGAQLFLDTMGGHTMPCVQGLIANSSANEHLKVTDFIIKVNDVSCLDKSIQDVVGMIRGEVGTFVKITVADTKEGKRPREYDLERRAIISSAPGGPPVQPVVDFNTQCETEVAKMKKTGNVVIKTFPSECGNYFFNFDAEKQTYHIRVWTMEDKNNEGEGAPFSISANVFDNANEKSKTLISGFKIIHNNDLNYGILEGTATFTKPGVGVVNVLPNDDKKKCRAMYVVIYK